MRLCIIDVHVRPGEICTQCSEPAVIKKLYRIQDYEWEMYSCRSCRRHNEFYQDGRCVRCGMPHRELICRLCVQELEGRQSSIRDTEGFMARLTAMFLYANVRYSGGTT